MTEEVSPGKLAIEKWTVTARINKAGNLAVEVDLNGMRHAELILQESGTTDLLTTARRQMDLGIKGWQAPGKPHSLRRFRFELEEADETDSLATDLEHSPERPRN